MVEAPLEELADPALKVRLLCGWWHWHFPLMIKRNSRLISLSSSSSGLAWFPA